MIDRHNRAGLYPLDYAVVGDLTDLPLGTLDPAVLAWAEDNDSILVTLEKSTMPRHLADHLALARHSPGVVIVRDGTPFADVVEYLVLAAHIADPDEFRDAWRFIP